MDCCDSPKKKKRKFNKKPPNNRECIVHVFTDENGAVAQFSERSWKVSSTNLRNQLKCFRVLGQNYLIYSFYLTVDVKIVLLFYFRQP